MSSSQTPTIDRNLRDELAARVESGDPVASEADLAEAVRPGSRLSGRALLELIECQFQARHLDLAARRLKRAGTDFYTIGSAGHEGNAAVAAALRPDDPAFLHYRSGGFFAARARQLEGQTPIFDVLLSPCAAADDPISGGRHKVFGSRAMWILPQTSTIASHLPKAMGMAFAIDRGGVLGLPMPVPSDAIVVCSLGDASINHSTSVGAINAALWALRRGWPMLILFVCEDNGIGISVQTPEGWIREAWGSRPGLSYFEADGLDLVETFEVTLQAANVCRSQRVPALLRLDLERLLGHAGNDIELSYRTSEEIKATEARDPLRRSCEIAIDSGVASAAFLLRCYEEIGQRVEAAEREAASRPHLRSVSEIVEPLAPLSVDAVAAESSRGDYRDEREAMFFVDHSPGESRAAVGRSLPEQRGPERLGRLINWGLRDLLAKYPEMLAFGEDVDRRGSVYGITDELQAAAGDQRVFDTLLDEQSILGMALGAGQLGMLPVPEIQYLAYLHNAIDQIRGEAATLQFFSKGQFRNPMVMRIASWGYQRGFGGHSHNDNAIAALRDIPGVIVACLSRGDDAVGMLRTCMALARVDGRVVLFLEPIALYLVRDLYDSGDGLWMTKFPAPGGCTAAAPFSKARVYEPGGVGLDGSECHDRSPPTSTCDLLIVSWGNGLWRSLRAARRLERDNDLRVRVVDLRWLQPLDLETLITQSRRAGSVLVVDEGRRTGGLSEAVVTAIVEGLSPHDDPDDPGEGRGAPNLARVCAEDSFVTLGPSWEQLLPSEDRIVERALQLVRHRYAAAPARA